jgi:hypothetical protein
MTNLPRRLLLALLPAALLAPHGADAAPSAAALRRALPPGLDPYAIGTALRATHPACSTADCRARAALPNPADLPARIAADFAAGRTVTVDGWVLSHTEAWLCAALA